MPGVQSNPLITQLDQLRRETPGCAERIHISGAEPDTMVEALRQQKINPTASLREHAVFDFDRKQVPWALRVSPHFYNSEEAIATVVPAIAEMAV